MAVHMLSHLVSAAGTADILVVSSSADVVECLLYVSAAGTADILVASSSADVVECLLRIDAETA